MVTFLLYLGQKICLWILINIVLIVRKILVKRYFSFFLIRVILLRRRHCLLWPWRCPGPTVPMDNLYQSMPDNLYHILLIDSYRSARKHSLHHHHWFTTGDTVPVWHSYEILNFQNWNLQHLFCFPFSAISWVPMIHRWAIKAEISIPLLKIMPGRTCLACKARKSGDIQDTAGDRHRGMDIFDGKLRIQ